MPAADYPVEVSSRTGCWKWIGKVGKDHYGRTTEGQLAYQVVYAAEVGAVPEGLQLDHQCRLRQCVSPVHLEPVSKRENERRKQMRHRVKIRKCPQGHDLFLNGINTVYGGKVCGYCSGVNPLRTK